MTEKIFDIVVLTDDRYVSPEKTNWYVQNILKEDGLVVDALKAKGYRVSRKSWSDPEYEMENPTRCDLSYLGED